MGKMPDIMAAVNISMRSYSITGTVPESLAAGCAKRPKRAAQIGFGRKGRRESGVRLDGRNKNLTYILREAMSRAMEGAAVAAQEKGPTIQVPL